MQAGSEPGGAGMVLRGAVERVGELVVVHETGGRRPRRSRARVRCWRRRSAKSMTVLAGLVTREAERCRRSLASRGWMRWMRTPSRGRAEVAITETSITPSLGGSPELPERRRGAVTERRRRLPSGEQRRGRIGKRQQPRVAEDQHPAMSTMPLATSHARLDLRRAPAQRDQLIRPRCAVLAATQPSRPRRPI